MLLANSYAYRQKAIKMTQTVSGETNDQVASLRGHPRFYELLNEMASLHDSKNADYAGDDDPLRNLKECEDLGVESWVGVVVRLTDKYSRLKTFTRRRSFKLKSESLKDTLLDNAIYSLLCLICYEEAQASSGGGK